MSSPLAGFLTEFGFVVLERTHAGLFHLLSDPPEWFRHIWPQASSAKKLSIEGVSPFLDNFLQDAESYWANGGKGLCESGTWMQESDIGKHHALEARALTLNGKNLLTIFAPEQQYKEKVQFLQAARDSLLEHEKLLHEIQKKEILLHCIVHDLSQPLSAMRGSFDCLAMESDSESKAKFIELGKHASEQQESMIREILNTFAADLQGSLNAEKETNVQPDLLLVAKEAASAMSPAFAAKGVRISLSEKIIVNTEWPVFGEETRLRRIFTNLLENALRYTPSGSSVTIGILDDGPFLKAYVDDEGPGLRSDFRPAEMFALFGKGKNRGGKAGLGLYFCRVTVERWGGAIGCYSLSGKGSRFWFRLPKAQLNPTVATEKTAEPVAVNVAKRRKLENRRGLRILLADDQEDIRLLTAHQLERSGHGVVTVGDGHAALAAVQAENFDVIFLDEEMPELRGVDVLRAIRKFQDKNAFRSAIVAFTGNNTPKDRVRLVEAGFDAVIGKPFRLESLDDFLRNSENTSASDLPGARPLKENSSVEDLLRRVGGDKKLLRQMIRTFLRETPKRIETINKSLEQENGVDLSAVAHALKGSLGIFGAGRAVQHAQSLQDLGGIKDFVEAANRFRLLQEEIANLEQNLRGYAKRTVAASSKNRLQEKPKSRVSKRGRKR